MPQPLRIGIDHMVSIAGKTDQCQPGIFSQANGQSRWRGYGGHQADPDHRAFLHHFETGPAGNDDITLRDIGPCA